jgi:hypothetical protein
MKKPVFLLFVSLCFLACQQKSQKKESTIDTIHVNTKLNENIVSNNKIEKLRIDGIYLPTKDLNVGKYNFESFSVSQDENKFGIELNLIDTTSKANVYKKDTHPKLKGDSIFFLLNDSDLGKLALRAHFLISPLDNPKVKENSTIVLKGTLTKDNQEQNIEFKYFAGD